MFYSISEISQMSKCHSEEIKRCYLACNQKPYNGKRIHPIEFLNQRLKLNKPKRSTSKLERNQSTLFSKQPN